MSTSQQGFNSIEIGDCGEALLRLWSSQASIVVTKAEQDRMGWDFLLEFPVADPAYDLPEDLAPCAAQALVQVKTTQSPRTRCQIKLDNAERLAKSPLPCFVLSVELGADRCPVRAHLVHLWRDWVELVLKTLRALPRGGRSTKHKKTVSVRVGDESLLDSMDGDGLRTAVLGHVGSSLSAYAAVKLEWAQRLGYKPLPNQLTFKYSPGSPDRWEDLVDFALGLRPNLSIVDVAVETNIRFDVPGASAQHKEGTIALGELPVADHVQVVFKGNEARRQRASLPGNLYVPNFLVPDIPEEHWKCVVRSSSCRIVIHPAAGRSELVFDYASLPREGSLDAIAAAWRPLAMFSKDAASIEVEIWQEHRQIFARLPLHTDNRYDQMRPYVPVAQIVDDAHFLARTFELVVPHTTLEAVVRQGQQLSTARLLCDTSSRPVSLPGRYFAIEALTEGERCGYPVVVSVTIGHHRIDLDVALVGHFSQGEDGGRISSTGCVFVQVAVVPTAEPILPEGDRLRRLREWLGQHGYTVVDHKEPSELPPEEIWG